MRSVHVKLRSDVDPATWRSRWEEGEVPGRAPYGFDRLVAACPRSKLGTLPNGRKIELVVGAIGARMKRRENHLTLCWDEESLLRAASTARLSTLACGVIWLTDDLARGSISPLKRHLMRKLIRRLAGVWVLSPAQVNPMRAWLGDGAETQVSFVPFGIDTDFFCRGNARFEKSNQRIVSVGNDRDRDPQTAIRILAKVKELRPHVDIVLQTNVKGIGHPAICTVPRLSATDLRDLYGSSALNFIATRPNLHVSGMTSALESMAMGIPTIATSTPGFDAYIDNMQTGILTHESEAVKHILRVLDSPEWARQLGERAQESVRAHHSESSFQNHLRQFIDQIGASRQRRFRA